MIFKLTRARDIGAELTACARHSRYNQRDVDVDIPELQQVLLQLEKTHALDK